MTTPHAKSNAREGDGVAEQVSALSRLHARLIRQLEADALLGDMAHSLRSAAEISALSKAIYAMQAQQGAEPVAGTPSSRWAANGEPDPHGTRYDCERAALAMGDLSDDELANAVFLHGNERPSVADVMAGKAFFPIAYLTAAKDRIRWLSRKLAATGAPR